MEGRLSEMVERKYVEDSRRLSLYWPSETITLHELHSGRKFIRLHSGDIHEFDGEEVSRLLERVPIYYWKLMKIPLMLRYYKDEGGTVKFIVDGEVWQARLAELLVKGIVSSEGLQYLSLQEFSNLISSYKSIVFITIDV